MSFCWIIPSESKLIGRTGKGHAPKLLAGRLSPFTAEHDHLPSLGSALATLFPHWRLFRDNGPLSTALPALAASVIEAWMTAKHGLRVGIIAILHTFNGRLEFNSHVHLMVLGGRAPGVVRLLGAQCAATRTA